MEQQSPLQQNFTAELATACRKAQEQTGCPMTGMLQKIEKYGGVGAAKDYIRKNRRSDGFTVLEQEGKLALSMEALVTASAYGTLFTDDEVNACFEALCAAGYYTSSYNRFR